MLTRLGVQGEAREVAQVFAAAAADVLQLEGGSGGAGVCVLAGGETTVTLRGGGRGGRNQELAAAAALELHRRRLGDYDVAVLSAGTDGTDGPTPAAGAVVTPRTVCQAGPVVEPGGQVVSAEDSLRAALRDNDSYTWLSQRAPAALVVTGPTGTNVMDVMLVVARPAQRKE